MIRNGLLVILLSSAAVVFAQGGSYIVEGKIRHADGMVIHFQSDEIHDSVVVTNGRFIFTGTIDKPYQMGYIYMGVLNQNTNDAQPIRIAVEPCRMTAEIDANEFNKAIVNGGKTQSEMNELEKALESASVDRPKLINDYIRSHPDSYISPQQLRYTMGRMKYEDLKQIYDGFTDNVKKYGNCDDIVKEITMLERLLPGKVAPDFTTEDINGNQFTLSSLKGQVVIVDFWASWCRPCRASNPHMLELYKNYHAKGLELVYISDDDSSPSAWRKAVEQDKLADIGIHHVLRGRKVIDRSKHIIDKSNDIHDKYAVHYLPTKYLIDRDGTIVCKIESNEQLDSEIERLLVSPNKPYVSNE